MSHIAEFVVIHNGIITNYKDIKTYLVSVFIPACSVSLKYCQLHNTVYVN